MPVGSGPPTRSRANSNSSGGGENRSIAASRPKRRGRGFAFAFNQDTERREDNSDKLSESNRYEKRPRGNNQEVPKSGAPLVGSLHPEQTTEASRSAPNLVATTNGGSFHVHLVVNGQPFVDMETDTINDSAQPTVTSRKRTRSQDLTKEKVVSATVSESLTKPQPSDHNLFHCHVCSKFGDVVCCDNCPHVYHKECIPADDPSRVSLENDEDPWFCPSCHKDSTVKPRICFVCMDPITNLDSNTLSTCTGCGKWAHSDCIPESTQERGDETLRPPVICEKCQEAKTANKIEKDESTLDSPGNKHKADEETSESAIADQSATTSPLTLRTTRRTRSASISERNRSDDEEVSEFDSDTQVAKLDTNKKEMSPQTPDESQAARKESHRKRLHPSQTLKRSPPSSQKKQRRERAKREKEKTIKSHSSTPSNRRGQNFDSMSHLSSYASFGGGGGTFSATPAFFFYLAENRSKIERSLSRRHRFFNRLPKSYERNELVAKEGANGWVKLRQTDVERFMDMSMRDFEERIVEWKEEKNIRDMLNLNNTDEGGDTNEVDISPDDELLTYKNHERLYLGTTVGSKPFKPESGISHNRILLELLQDMRFHPLPMIMTNRTDKDYGQMDFSRISIPYFDVHGPIATSMGDECLGCTRGWTHYCNVLKRRIPAVQHRAKLQPPLSSLMATRIGLGLQPNSGGPVNDTEDTLKNIEMYSVREDPEMTEAKNLPVFCKEVLPEPSSRADDIVQFIEETVAMKVPEPSRPSHPLKLDTARKSYGRASLPTRVRKRKNQGYDKSGFDNNDGHVVNKCGRCRTVILTDTGCIQCRRAQLVINMSKKGVRENEGSPDSKNKGARASDFLEVSTHMLGRVTMKEGNGELQSEGDSAIANGILRQRWTPFAILPSQTKESPISNPAPYESKDEEGSMTDESQSESSDEGQTSDSDSRVRRRETVLAEKDEENSIDMNVGESKGSKRPRSARIGAKSLPDQNDDIDRQEMAEMFKEETDELQRKCLQVACGGILLGLMRRDPLLLFANPVTAEGYLNIIKRPMDFGRIRSNVLGGTYATFGAFISDCRLLCTNALTYNPPGSIYWKTAKELYDVLAHMQKRASDWMVAIKDSHAQAWRRDTMQRSRDDSEILDGSLDDDLFGSLRKEWPEAVEMFENSDWLRKHLSADFMRTKENETAYYGGLAVRRAAVAAEISLAPYPDKSGIYNSVGRRTHAEDDTLRRVINERVALSVDPMQLKDLPTWREESVIRVMRRAQSRRLDGLIGSVNGCARCDGMRVDQDLKVAMTAETLRWGRTRKKNNELARIASSRIDLSTGLGSQNTQETIKQQREILSKAKSLAEKSICAQKAAVTVKGSRIHGWGLYADQPFKKGDVVAEYIGEYVSLATTEAREKMYQEQRIQDYQFRLDDQLVIDATMQGGHGRYINHNCSPNCIAKTILGDPPNEHKKRVLIIAQRDIKPREELSYDYQFPLELDLDARIPCNCHSEHCRGFMNWDLPEKGSNSRIFRSQKRGANMRDRIRRLGRPLKNDK